MIRKNIVKGISLLFLILAAGRVQSQCTATLPSTVDKIAKPTLNSGGCPSTTFVTTTSNTGTDVFNDGTSTYQVMVWDGNNAALSWDVGGVTGSIPFATMSGLGGAGITDPDVVVNRGSATINTMLVAQVTSGANINKIFWATFKWSGSAFVYVTSGFLGNVTADGPCRTPNIDVNACGRIAIVWSQGIVYNFTIDVTGGPFTFPSTVVPVLRSDIYWAQGFVDGTSCTGAGTVAGVTTATGDRISYPIGIPHLFESNINPDVAFSDPASGTCAGGQFLISVAYVNRWFVASTFSITSQVVVRQFKNSTCINAGGLSSEYAFNSNGAAGFPRIAARPTTGSMYDDFQVVMADPASVCNAGGPPCQFLNNRIYNWGKHNGVVAPLSPLAPNILNMTPISPCNLSTIYNDQPVVTYRDLGTTTSGDFVVAWTVDQSIITNVVNKDVIAKTYNQGIANLAASPQFSIVNKGCTSNTSNQSLPSIAGRYWKEVGYNFYDNASTAGKPYIGYRLSTVAPGNAAALRVSGHFDPASGKSDETFTALPNPFNSEISFQVSLGTENKASQIEIRDVSGRLVETLKVNADADEVKWKPAADVKSGMYFAKLFTDKGIMLTQIVKE